jgi:uroporphyrinogen decarboxylase
MTALTDLTNRLPAGPAGRRVDAIQLFDSWAGTLSHGRLPQQRAAAQQPIFATLAGHGGWPKTHFGVGTAELLGAMGEAGATVVGVDWRTSLTAAAERVGPGKALQGNLDPVTLFAGWPVVERAARTVVEDGRRAIAAGAAGHIFNLGHGVLPATDPGVVTDLVALVHSL